MQWRLDAAQLSRWRESQSLAAHGNTQHLHDTIGIGSMNVSIMSSEDGAVQSNSAHGVVQYWLLYELAIDVCCV